MKKVYLANLLMLFIIHTAFSQYIPINYSCNTILNSASRFSFPGPIYKPLKTKISEDSAAFLRVLMVFVEFKDDDSWDPNSVYWPPNSFPVYADSLFSPVKNPNGYPKHIISDYFKTVTRGDADFIGDVYHLKLPHSYEHYKTTYGNNESGRNAANLDVLKMLDTNLYIDWNRYDRWGYNNTFEFIPDNYIDMVYIQYRRGKPDFFALTSGGHADLMVTYSTLQQNKIILQGTSNLSSGIYGINGSSEPKIVVLDYFIHEYCHYILGSHRPYSRVSGGEGTETQHGWERAFSPQDEISLGLANIIEADWYMETIYSLPDFITTGTVLKIPTTLISNDYFLVCNRRRLVKYDCNTGGDTVMANLFQSAGDLDKGVYIYHVFDGNTYDAWCDLECADGLWDWQFSGTSTPNWSNSQLLPLFEKIRPGSLNDESAITYDSRRMISRDGFSVVCINCPGVNFHTKWFSTGKRHTYIGDPGMDKKYTNFEQNWCSMECLGDRYDLWKTGYNNLFSPYSNPSSLSRSTRIESDTSGVFIQIISDNSDTAKIKVYRKDLRGYSEAQILVITPPSRPSLYKIALVNCNGVLANPKITWYNNNEPDMLRTGNFKQYKIYRAVSHDPNAVPVNYVYAGIYNDHTPYDTANYIDGYIGLLCNNAEIITPAYVRYYVTAMDNRGDESVPSDFVSISGNVQNQNQQSLNNKSIYLFENYPNPFNPITKIKFSIPFFSDGEKQEVKLIIYNILGKEIATLVNDQLKPGTYEVTWDASNYPSGVYFNKLITSVYSKSRKMILVK